jgi:SAM-dependent methyltransferase/outer membrane murein-binding lipoprotein Lpp
MKVMEFSKDFYLEFENKFRGPRELILDRLKVYEPILKFVATLAEKPLVLDLGCGRGEFLELCNKFGIEVLGVDASEKNVELVKSLGFKAHKDDILNFLKKQESNSYNLVSLIHVVEHLEFCYVLELFKEVHRILKSGGIFIVETPYVKSPLAAFNFWVDPTHKRPIHPELLKFIGEKMGFSIIEIFPLAGKSRKDTVSLTDILYSSPDVSIILVKDTDDKYYLEKVKNVLSKVRAQASLDLEEVSLRLTQEHSSIAEEVQKLSATLAQLNQRVELTEGVSLRLTQEHSSIAEEVQKLSATLAQLNQRVELTNKEISYVKSRLDALWNSKPWRAYQLIGKTILRISNLKGKIKSFLRSLLKNVYKRLTRYPRIYTKIKKVLDQHPNIKEKLVSLVTPENKVSSRSDERIESKSPNTIYPTDIFLKRIRRWR